LKRIFSWQPFNLYNNTAYQPNWAATPGEEIMPGEKCEKNPESCPALEKPENVIGMQCSTWSETLMNDYEMEVAIFPRVFACAERAYNPNPSFQSLHDVTNFKPLFENFLNRLGPYVEGLDKEEIKYNIPPPGVSKSSDGTCSMNSLIPGLEVVQDVNTFRTYSSDSKQHSRVVEFETNAECTCTTCAAESWADKIAFSVLLFFLVISA